MVKKAVRLTRPASARRDAPFPKRGAAGAEAKRM